MTVQYTIRGVPGEVDSKLREQARQAGQSLNALVVQRLTWTALPRGTQHDDLDWFIGSEAETAGDDAAQAWLDSLPNDLP